MDFTVVKLDCVWKLRNTLLVLQEYDFVFQTQNKLVFLSSNSNSTLFAVFLPLMQPTEAMLKNNSRSGCSGTPDQARLFWKLRNSPGLMFLTLPLFPLLTPLPLKKNIKETQPPTLPVSLRFSFFIKTPLYTPTRKNVTGRPCSETAFIILYLNICFINQFHYVNSVFLLMNETTDIHLNCCSSSSPEINLLCHDQVIFEHSKNSQLKLNCLHLV